MSETSLDQITASSQYQYHNSTSGRYLKKPIFSRNKSARILKKNGNVVKPFKARVCLFIGTARIFRNEMGKSIHDYRIKKIQDMPRAIKATLNRITNQTISVSDTIESLSCHISQKRKNHLKELVRIQPNAPTKEVFNYLSVYYSSLVSEGLEKSDLATTLATAIEACTTPNQLAFFNKVIKQALNEKKITPYKYDKLRKQIVGSSRVEIQKLIDIKIDTEDYNTGKQQLHDTQHHMDFIDKNTKTVGYFRSFLQKHKARSNIQKEAKLVVANITNGFAEKIKTLLEDIEANQIDKSTKFTQICEALDCIIDTVADAELYYTTNTAFNSFFNDLCFCFITDITENKAAYMKDAKIVKKIIDMNSNINWLHNFISSFTNNSKLIKHNKDDTKFDTIYEDVQSCGYIKQHEENIKPKPKKEEGTPAQSPGGLINITIGNVNGDKSKPNT